MVLAAVQENGLALKWAAEVLRSNHDIVLAAVQQNGQALQWAAEALKKNHGMVLAAVQQHSHALQWADEPLKSNHDIVLAAVQKNGQALKWATEALKSNHDIVLSAVEEERLHCWFVLKWATDDLLSNISFVSKLKNSNAAGAKGLYFVKITLLSGRWTIVLCDPHQAIGEVSYVIKTCCKKLELAHTGNEALFHDREEVPAGTNVNQWPGFQPDGISEYSLMVQSRLESLD
eukprot:1257934-Amphidinium_carterae.1